MKIQTCALPTGSRIIQLQPSADFADCHRFANTRPEASALESYLALITQTPNWMNTLMALRNQVVRLVGLKHLGALGAFNASKPASAYQIGDRVGIFSLRHVQPNEVILEDDDKHLHVQVSLFKHEVRGQAVLSMSTVIHNHNRLGRVYMSVVGPVHRRIVPLMLAQAARG